jgi:N-hydroxyarylamine O-acetyltransferase
MGDAQLDFDASAERIGFRGTSAVSNDTLEGIVLAHCLRIPFENLDIHLGNPIDLDPARVFEKLVLRRRGGYCFEQNGLLLEVLRTLGFTVRPVAARVFSETTLEKPRTHMALFVEVGARTFLVDVGFGNANPLAPLPFEPGRERDLHGEAYRITEIPWTGKALGAPPAFDLETKKPDGSWKPLYRISLEEQRHADFVMASWFCSAHPDSPFVRRKLVALPEVGTRRVMLDRELEVRRGGVSEKKTIEGDDAYRAVLREIFTIDLGSDALLRW